MLSDMETSWMGEDEMEQDSMGELKGTQSVVDGYEHICSTI